MIYLILMNVVNAHGRYDQDLGKKVETANLYPSFRRDVHKSNQGLQNGYAK